MCRARAHGGGAIKLVARALLKHRHRDGTEAPLRCVYTGGIFGTATATTATRSAFPERVLRHCWLSIGRALRRGRRHRMAGGWGWHRLEVAEHFVVHEQQWTTTLRARLHAWGLSAATVASKYAHRKHTRTRALCCQYVRLALMSS